MNYKSIENIKKNAISGVEEGLLISQKYNFEKSISKLEEVKKNVTNYKIKAPLIGLFNAGKSSILNAYFGIENLPENITPETAIACELIYNSSEDYLEVITEKNEVKKMSVSDLKNLKSKDNKFVNMHLNNKKLKELGDLILVDMPGLDSDYKEHNKAIANYLNEASYFIIIMDAENGTPKGSLLNFLTECELYNFNFAILISKIDTKTESQVTDIISNTKETVINITGYDVLVASISAKDKKIENFDKLLSNMDIELLAKTKLFNEVVKNLQEEVLKELNRTMQYSYFNSNEIDKKVKELENSEKNIEKTISKEISSLKTKINYEIVDGIMGDLSITLSNNADMIAAKAINAESSLGTTLNQLIRPAIAKSFDIHLKKALTDIYERVNIDISSVLTGLDLQVNLDKVDAGINEKEIDNAVKGLLDLASKHLPAAGIGGAMALAGTAAATTAITAANVLLPIVGLLITAFIPMIGGFIKNLQKEKMNEKIKEQIHTIVIPQVIAEIRPNIEVAIQSQTDAFMKAVKEKYDDEKEKIKSTLLEAKKEREDNKVEYEKKITGIKDDIVFVNKIIESMKI